MELENIILSEITRTLKGHAWYVLTNKWILDAPKVQNAQYRFHRTQKGQQAKGPSEYTSVPLGRDKKAITRGEGGRDLGGEVNGTWLWERGEHDMVLGGGKELKP